MLNYLHLQYRFCKQIGISFSKDFLDPVWMKPVISPYAGNDFEKKEKS
jgi:hypothetical protein